MHRPCSIPACINLRADLSLLSHMSAESALTSPCASCVVLTATLTTASGFAQHLSPRDLRAPQRPTSSHAPLTPTTVSGLSTTLVHLASMPRALPDPCTSSMGEDEEMVEVDVLPESEEDNARPKARATTATAPTQRARTTTAEPPRIVLEPLAAGTEAAIVGGHHEGLVGSHVLTSCRRQTVAPGTSVLWWGPGSRSAGPSRSTCNI